MNKILKKIFVLTLFLITMFSPTLTMGATLKGYDNNRPELADSFLSTLKDKNLGITGASIGSKGLENLNEVIDAYESKSKLAKELKHHGGYDGDIQADAYVKRSGLTKEDKEFLHDYGLVSTLAITPYDVSYYWGGNHGAVIDESGTQKGMDCSGFTHFALRSGFGLEHGSLTAHGYNVSYGKATNGGTTNEVKVRMFNYYGNGNYDHVGLVSGNAQVHARGGEAPSKWKTVDVTTHTKSSVMSEVPVMDLIGVKGVTQRSPFSPSKIKNLVQMMTTGNRAGGTDATNERNSDRSDLEITSGSQFLLRINLEKVILKPYLLAIKEVFKNITKYVLAIYVLLATLDFSIFALRNILSNGDLAGVKGLVMLGQRFVRYVSYITLIQMWEILVVKPTMGLFSGGLIKQLLQGLELSRISEGGTDGSFSSVSLIFQEIVLAPLDSYIDVMRTIASNVIDVVKTFSGDIIIPYGGTFLGSNTHSVGITNIVVVTYLFVLAFCLVNITICGIIITFIYGMYMVLNIILCIIEAMIVSTFSIFTAMLGGLDILNGFGIVAILSNIFVPLTKILVTYVYIIMTLQFLEKMREIFPINEEFTVLIMFPARVLCTILMFALLLMLYRGTVKIIGDGGI